MGHKKQHQNKREVQRCKSKAYRENQLKQKQQNKEAKKDPTKRKELKKDLGLPQLASFKQTFASRLERIAEKSERQRARQKQDRDRMVEEQRNQMSLHELAINALDRGRAFSLKEQSSSSAEALQSMSDGSKKAFFREFKKVVKAADVILEVLDSRDPLGCRCPDVEQMILSQDPNKKIILILNKIDLVPKENVEKWLKYLRNEYPTLAFKCSTQKKGKIGQASGPLQSDTSECLGADTLIQLLKNYSRSLNMKTSITVGIIGYPNVGKSSLINSLKRERAVGVGATPGYTRSIQEVHIDKHVKLLDCPGIVFSESSSESDLVLRNCIKIEQITDTIRPVDLILSRCRREKLMELYKIPIYNDVKEFLSFIAHKRGKLGKGGVPEYEAAARTVIQDWNSGRIAFYTEPPKEKRGIHLSAQLVPQFSQEINLDEIVINEQSSVLSGLGNTENDHFMSLGMSVFSSTVDSNLMRHLATEVDEIGDCEEEKQDIQYVVQGNDNILSTANEMVDQGDQSTTTYPQQRKLLDNESQINPQTQKEKKKKLKLMRKMKKKGLNTGEDTEELIDPDESESVDTLESVTDRLGLFTPEDLLKFLDGKKAKNRKRNEGDGCGGMEEEELFDVDEMNN